MAAPRDYRRLSLAAKQRVTLDRQREPAMACPVCETGTSAADLLGHLDRCPGPREPHPLSQWITWRSAVTLGVAKQTLSDWVRRGEVRMREGATLFDRRYLLRDVARRIATRRQRRGSGLPDSRRRR